MSCLQIERLAFRVLVSIENDVTIFYWILFALMWILDRMLGKIKSFLMTVKKLQKGNANLIGWLQLSLVKAVCIYRKSNTAIQHCCQLSIIKWQLAARNFCGWLRSSITKKAVDVVYFIVANRGVQHLLVAYDCLKPNCQYKVSDYSKSFFYKAEQQTTIQLGGCCLKSNIRCCNSQMLLCQSLDIYMKYMTASQFHNLEFHESPISRIAVEKECVSITLDYAFLLRHHSDNPYSKELSINECVSTFNGVVNPH